MAKKTGPAEVPPSRETWFPDEKPRDPEDKWDPFGPAGSPAKAKKDPVAPAVDPKDYIALPASDNPEVIKHKDLAGNDIYAWRKDGVKPVIDLDDFARNINSALAGTPGADFADHYGPR